ncbi:MAG: hypothetical protein RL362_1104 [Bacteroidota bacterium]
MLWGLTALSVPIIVHLFNFRKHKTLYFPFTSFLSEVKTESQKKSKLRHLLILLLRLLAIAAIVFAFAQPILPLDRGNSGKKLVSIYIDNSLSMENSKNEISLLDNAKNRALDIVFAYNENDLFQIISNDFKGIQQHFVSKNKAIEIIQSIQLGPINRSIKEVWERQRDLFEKDQNPNKKVFWISDFQKSTTSLDDLKLMEGIDYRWVPIQNSESPNVYVDTIYFESPAHLTNQEEKLLIVLKNSGNSDIQDVRCELNINNQNKGVTSVSIPSGGEQIISFQLTPAQEGIQIGSIILNDLPIQFDNKYFFSYQVESSRTIGILGENTHAAEVFMNDPHFKSTLYRPSSLDVQSWLSNDVLIIENVPEISSGIMAAAIEATKNGKTLVVLPGISGIASWNSYFPQINLGSKIELISQNMAGKELDYESALFRNIFDSKDKFDLPYSEKHWRWTPSSSMLTVLKYINSDPMIAFAPLGNGSVWVMNVDLEHTNLFSHSVFPISLVRVSELASTPQPLDFTLGQTTPMRLRNLNLQGDNQLQMKNRTTNETFIPLVRNIQNNTEISMGPFLPSTGHYDIVWNQKSIYTIGVNAGNLESQLQFYNLEELEAQKLKYEGLCDIEIIDDGIENIGNLVTKMDEGKHLWWFLIIIALTCLLTESILIGIWKM